MEDPKYNASIKVGSKESSYSFLAFPRGVTGGLQASQSFILQLTFTDEQSPGQPFDISGATATLYCSGYNVTDYPETILGAGVLSDSGSGTTDTVTFTVTKDQIPDDLGNLPTSKTGNSVFYCILEDADTKLQFYQSLNVLDEKFQLTGANSVSDNIILVGDNDLGTVINTQLTTPPVSPVLNDSYIVGVGSTGDWSGQDKKLAVWNGAAWIYRDPEVGNFVYDTAAEATYTYTSSLIWDVVVVADGSITEAKLATSSVTNTKLATDSVSQDKMQDNSIGTDEVINGSITNAKSADMAESTIKGRASGTGTGAPTDLTASQVRTNIDYDTTLAGTQNTTPFTPTQDYHVATKKYVDDNTPSLGVGDLNDVTITGEQQGDLLLRGTAGYENLTAGPTGQFLKSQGPGNDLVWESIPGGGDMLASTYDPAGVAEQLVGLDSAQALTNKTIDGVSLTTLGSSSDYLNAAGSYTAIPGGTDEAVKVSSNDTTSGFLGSKIVAGSNITVTELNDGGNETLEISSTGGFPTGRVTGLATTGTVNIDWSDGYFIIGTMTGGINITFSNVSQGQTIYIDVTGASGYEFELPISVTTTLEGTSFTPNVRNIIRIDAVNGATAQEAVFNLDTESTSTFDASKNLIIDGQFNHWDEGTSFTVDGYSSTVWRFSEGGGAATITRQAFTLGQTDVPDNPKYFLQHDQTSNGTGVEILSQRLINSTRFSGEALTQGFYAKVSSGTLDVTPAIRQNFGTGGSPSAEVETQASAAVTLTTSWQFFSTTITLPSVSGKTLGSNNDDYLEFVLLADDAATTFTAQLANISDVQGPTAFAGPWPTAEEERSRINPFFEVIGNYEEGSPISGAPIHIGPEDSISSSTARRATIQYTKKIGVPDVSYGTVTNGSSPANVAVGKDALKFSATATSGSSNTTIDYIILDSRL
jgi:hypothetical protein